jgi:hypothetical protein
MAEETTKQGLGLALGVDLDHKEYDKNAKKVEKRVDKLGKKLDNAIRKQHKSELDKHKAFEKFQDDTSNRYRQELNELKQLEKARKRVRSYKIEADSLRSKGISDKDYHDDQEFVKYEGGRQKMERKNALNKNKKTTSKMSINNMDASIYSFSRGLLQLTDSFEKAGKKMSATNIAMQMLGKDASMKRLKEMEKHISKGKGKVRTTAMAGLAIGGGAAYAGFQGAKGDKISDVRENEYYPKVNETMSGLMANIGGFELFENELLKSRKDIILSGKSVYAGLEDEVAQARIDAIKSWKGTFEEATQDTFGIDTLKKNLESQLKVIKEFNKNMQDLIKSGAPDEMIAQMLETGATAENAGYAKALANSSKGDQQEVFSLFNSGQNEEIAMTATVGLDVDIKAEIKAME